MAAGRKQKEITIVGLGLMGASLAMALKKVKGYRITGLCRKVATIQKAKKRGIIDGGTTSAEVAFKNASIIIIATPVSSIAPHLILADAFAKPGTLVTDVGSTKEALVIWARKQEFENIEYIGSHPLAGSHENGLEHAVVGLYQKATCFVTIGAKTRKESLKELIHLWQQVGAKVCLIDPKEHDRLLAATSHFPHLLAYALIQATIKGHRDALSFAGPGYKGMTRVAQSHALLWSDIVLSNRGNIVREIRHLIKELEGIIRLVEKGKEASLTAYLEKARRIRATL